MEASKSVSVRPVGLGSVEMEPRAALPTPNRARRVRTTAGAFLKLKLELSLFGI